MKKFNILIAVAICVIGMTSCQDGDWDKNINYAYTIGNDTIKESSRYHITIKDLKVKYQKAILGTGKYSNNTVQLIEENLQLKATVVTNDEGGNLSQCIIVTDESGENIQISIADNDIMTYLPVGEVILVNLNGLYIGGYSETPQIGYPNEKYASTIDSETGEYVGSQIYRMSFMTRFQWYNHFKSVGRRYISNMPDTYKDAFNGVALTDDMYSDQLNVSRLVYVDGTFKSNSGSIKIAEPSRVESTDTGNGVNETFKGTTVTKSIIVRTSTYADFASELIPATDVRLYGIFTRDTYKSGYQMQLRNADDIRIWCAGCNDYVGSTQWTKTYDGDYVCNHCGTVVTGKYKK